MKGIVIIGAGECGVRAAFALREQSYAKPITLIGAEATLPYERPPLSKSVHPEPRPIRNLQNYREADINLQLFPGLEGCLTLRTQDDAERIVSHFGQDRNIGIIGGGFIGLELAATARLAGCRVTVIEAAPRLMQRAVPMQIATRIQARHEMEGVEVRTGTSVVSANATEIVLGDGTRLSFDVVIAGVGAVPETALGQAADRAGIDILSIEGRFFSTEMREAAGSCFVQVGLPYGPAGELATAEDYLRAAFHFRALGGDCFYCAASLVQGERIAAFGEFIDDINSEAYPAPEHTVPIDNAEYEAFLTLIGERQ